MNITEAAERLQVSPKTVRRWIQKGKLNATKVTDNGAKEWVVQEEDISALLALDTAELDEPKPVVHETLAPSFERPIALLENVLTTLKEQIDRKDAQIAYLQHQIHDLNEQQKALNAPKKRWWQRSSKN